MLLKELNSFLSLQSNKFLSSEKLVKSPNVPFITEFFKKMGHIFDNYN